MKKYVLKYLDYINTTLKSDSPKDFERLKDEHLRQIKFIQHERLIHLLVTCLFSIILFMCIMGVVCFEKAVLIPLIILILVLLIPYIAHYYFLENNVQKMYGIYNQILICEENYLKNRGDSQ